MRAKAVFGTACNMPHATHALLCTALARHPRISEVLFIPSGDRKDKKQLQPANIRLIMAQLMVQDLSPDVQSKITIDRCEIFGDALFSRDLMRLLKEREPDVDFYFFVGADLVSPCEKWGGECEILHHWENGREFFHENKFIVARRSGYQNPESLYEAQEKFIFLDTEETPNSSTNITQLIARGEPWEHLVTPSVVTYIKQNNLYK